MTAITISRQLGSPGTQVAHAVAHRLGYRAVWREVINQAARRAGQAILRNCPDVLHVKTTAPLGLRIARIASVQNVPIEAARAQVEASDRSRRNYLRRYYHARWDDPKLNDLVVNTERWTPEAAADLACQALARCLQAAAPNAAQEGERPLE